jgi:hypothetical protein
MNAAYYPPPPYYYRLTARAHSPPTATFAATFIIYLNTHFMRVFILCCTALLCTTACHAQLEKGTWLVGGSALFYSYTGKYISPINSYTSKATNIDVKAGIGYFIQDKLIIGVRPSLFLSNGKYYRDGEEIGAFSSNTQLLIGPFSRYYIMEMQKPFNIFFDASYLFGINSSPLPPKSNGPLRELSFFLGGEFFFNSSIGVEFLFGFKKKREDINGINGYTDNKSGFFSGIGFQFHLQYD